MSKKYSALSLEYGPVTIVKSEDILVIKNKKELYRSSDIHSYKETKEFYEFYKNGTCFCKVLKSSLLLLEELWEKRRLH